MKNIAIPLLVAGSANAQLGDMSKDDAVRAPTLIATTLLADGCTDAAVVTAKSDLAAQDGVLATARAAINLVDVATTKSPQMVFDEALAARVAASDAVQVAQTASAALFATDDAARAAVAAARLALGTAEAIRIAAAEVDRLATEAKTQAATDLGAAVVQVVEVVGVPASNGVPEVVAVAPVAAVAASGATALKATLTTAQAAAVAHVTHERQELAQLECRSNRTITAQNVGTAGTRAPAKCETANGANTTSCTVFRANLNECEFTDGATASTKRQSSAADCKFTAEANMLPYLEPTYSSTASTTNCSAPAVDGIARTTDGLTGIPGKPAITSLAAADGLQAIATAKALILTQTTSNPEADNATLKPTAKQLAATLTLEQKMAEMTERAFSATRAAGQAAARYREVQSLWTKRVTYDTAVSLRLNPATAGQEGKADADAKLALIANPGGALSDILVQTAVTDAAMAVLDVTAVAQYKDNTADANTTVSDAEVGAFITLARTLSEATQTYWATIAAGDLYTAVVTATASGAARCVKTDGLDAEDATCKAIGNNTDCGTAATCSWQAEVALGAAGPCDITTASQWAISITADQTNAANIAACEGECTKLLPWSKSTDAATLNLPVPAFVVGSGGNTYCFGYSYNSVEGTQANKCKIFVQAIPAGGIATYSGVAADKCSLRNQSREASAYQVAYAAAMVTTSGTAGAGSTAETAQAMAIRRLTAQAAAQKTAASAASKLRMVARMGQLIGETAVTKQPGSSTNSCAGADNTHAACNAIDTAGGIALNTNTACVAAKQTNGTDACVWTAGGTNSVLASTAIPAPWGLSTGSVALAAAATAWKGTTASTALVADKTATVTAADITAGGASAEATVVTAEAARVTHAGNYNTALTASNTAAAALAANAAEITSTWVEITAQEQIKLYADAQLARATAVFDDLVTKSTATLVATAVATTGLSTTLTNAQVAARASTKALTGIDTISLELEQTPAVGSTLATLNGLRGTFATKVGELAAAKATISGLDSTIATELGKQVKLAATLAEKIQACEVAAFLKYSQELATAVQQRKDDLKTIKDMLAAITVPARGAAGARCEKAFSNGTFRPARTNASGADDKSHLLTGGCGDTLCCGAAVVPAGTAGDAVMTIETCQKAEGTTTYAYQPRRAAMALTMPATQSVPWTCISGAKKLVSAASALAAAVYVLA